MALLNEPADFTASTLTVLALNAFKNRVYEEIGTSSGGDKPGDDQGNLSNLNIAVAAAIQKAKIADTAVVCGNTVDTGTQTITRPTVFTGGFTASGTVTVTPNIGTGGETASLGGLIDFQAGATGNVGGGEDNLFSYTLPANTLTTSLRGIKITGAGTTSGANPVIVRLKFGATTIVSHTLDNVAGGWEVEAKVFRTALNTQVTWSFARQGGASADPINVQYTAAAITETATIVLQFTGEGTANNDIVQNVMMVEAL